MELIDYARIIKKNVILILAISTGCLIVASFLARSLQSGYSQTQTFFVTSPSGLLRQSLGPYYAQENARNFTDTAIAILESPEFASELQMKGSISVQKIAPQVIRITATGSDVSSTRSLMQNTLNAINFKLSDLHENQYQPQLKEVGKAPEPSKINLDEKVFAAFGFILGLAISLVAISLKIYFKL